MKSIKWVLTYWLMFFVPPFYVCWQFKHKDRPLAVLTRAIYLLIKKNYEQRQNKNNSF